MPYEIEDAEIVHKKGDAVLVEAPEFDEDGEWIPYSQIHDHSYVYKVGDKGTLIIKDWLARKRGWI